MRNQGSTAAPPRSRRSIWQNISVMLFAVALGISAASSLMKGAAGVTTINVATAVLGISVVVGIVAYYDDPQMDSVIRLPLQGVKAATRTISVIAGLLILASLESLSEFKNFLILFILVEITLAAVAPVIGLLAGLESVQSGGQGGEALTGGQRAKAAKPILDWLLSLFVVLFCAGTYGLIKWKFSEELAQDFEWLRKAAAALAIVVFFTGMSKVVSEGRTEYLVAIDAVCADGKSETRDKIESHANKVAKDCMKMQWIWQVGSIIVLGLLRLLFVVAARLLG